MTGLALASDGRLKGGPLDDPRVLRVLDLLNPAGEETRLVGGVVRNVLLGQAYGDIDLATTLTPPAVQKLAKSARLRTIPTGIAHGTVTLLVEGLPLEVTTLREDVETDGRHAVVRFGRDFEADAQRRDFTINALSVGRNGHVFDYIGGLGDLEGRRVRFIGDPQRRIREDYLRILRFFRFHATYGAGPFDPAGLAAVIANRAGLAQLSRERIWAEMSRILTAPRTVAALKAMEEAEILAPLIGRTAHPEALARLAAIDPSPGDALLRLAALALRQDGDAERLRDALRLSNAETIRLGAALAARGVFGDGREPPNSAGLRRLLFAHGRMAASDALRLAYAEGSRDDADIWRRAVAEVADLDIPVLPVAGGDMLARGLVGPSVGEALAILKAAWATAGFPKDPAEVAALVEAAAAIVRRNPRAIS